MSEVYPLAILIDELKHDDVVTRTAAMKRLSTVALALGEDRTRAELLPFLEDVATEDEDEILTLLGEELRQFTQYLGGPQYTHLLFPVLEKLAASDEPLVRNTSVDTLKSLAAEMSDEDLVAQFTPLVLSLANSKWSSSQIASTSLFEPAFKGLLKSNGQSSEKCQELVQKFMLLVSHDSPMVRRAAGTSLPALNTLLTECPDQLLEMFTSLAKDDQDSVKLLAVEAGISLGNSIHSLISQITTLMFSLLENRSWRVRYQAASKYGDIVAMIKHNQEVYNECYDHQLEVFAKLADDCESDVKVSISSQVVEFAKTGVTEEHLVAKIVPCLENLTNDPSETVREALAGKIAHLSPIFGQQHTIEYLLPLFLQMLKDEFSEVRLQIISNLDVINDVIGIDKLGESLLPAISDLAKDKQWRVLLAVIEYSPLLAKQLGIDFFNSELVPLVISWLWDPVWAIRDAAASNLIKLGEVFGIEWLETQIVPKLINFQDINSGYLTRFTALLALQKIVLVLSTDCLVNTVLPLILELSEDPVANVRFNTAKTFALIAKAGVSSDIIDGEILPVVTKLISDEDVDVKYFAEQALNEIKS